MTVKPLSPSALYNGCDPAIFKFKTTDDLVPKDEIYGQPRAVDAIRFAIGMESEGYNLFAAGPEGIGRFSLIERFLTAAAAAQPVPDDWCYVNNFTEPHKPKALRLPPGRAAALRQEMQHLVEELRGAIPAAFETDEYRNRRSTIEESLKEIHEEHFNGLQEEAKKRGVAVVQTPMGFTVAPIHDSEVMSPKDFEALPQAEKDQRKEGMEEIQKQLEETLRQMPKLEREQREKLRQLNQEVTRYAVGYLIDDLKRRWSDLPDVVLYFEAVRADVVDNVDDFLPGAGEKQGEGGPPIPKAMREEAAFRRYRVNVVVDGASAAAVPLSPPAGTTSKTMAASRKGAPVIYEDHPTQPNLSGRIEHLSQFGALVTDFNLIKPGMLHRANGGYLVLDARKLLMQPFAWDTLMRALRSESIRIETPAEALGYASTVTLEPEPIPLKVKVVLIGDPSLYHMIRQADPDFREMFKVTADFDSVMDRTDETARHIAQIVATLTQREKLRALDRGAVARVVEHASRLIEDQERLSIHFRAIADLVREASYWAGQESKDIIVAKHVQRAIDAGIFRHDRIRERMDEQVLRGVMVIDTSGARVGQVNGLSVLSLDNFAFGKPARISCSVSLGRGQVIDIEREVALGGALHSKGVLILSSFLSGRFACDRPLSLRASLVFEQSYGGVDGDSASSAELYSLLSALSGIPIKQCYAVTGSVDQYGTVQAIGGVNEKIEGFFDICKARGLTGEQGVLIPATNVKHLMLRADVVEACKAKKFRVFPVETIDQGIEILTGRKAGAAARGGKFPKGSLNAAVSDALDGFARRALAFALDGKRGARRKQVRKTSRGPSKR
jgi:lon-related putative ATP-dependent protease